MIYSAVFLFSSLSYCSAPPDSSEFYSGKITIIPNAKYDAGNIHRFLFGDHWRDLWATPVEVNVLNLNNYAGGFTPEDISVGGYTSRLKLKDKYGREYTFRPMNKDVSEIFPDEVQKAFAPRILQDQRSTANPAAPLIIYPLLKAIDLQQAQPKLFVLQGEGLPGKIKDNYAGIAGFFEANQGENEYKAAFTGAEKKSGTYSLIKNLDESNDSRVNAQEYLKTRLIDIFINDWDRHIDQWQWAAINENGFKTWYRIDIERNQAFAKFDGLLPWLSTIFVKKLVSFSGKYGSIKNLTLSGRYTDRRLLSSINKSEWDSITGFITGRLTDSVIIAAVKEMPAEMYAQGGEKLTSDLISRRDKLKEASDEFYNIISEYVNIYGSNKDEYAEVARLDDKRTEVNIYKKNSSTGSTGKQLFHRIFITGETKEIRLILLDGNDSVLVKGDAADGIKVIASAGRGENALIDSSEIKGKLLGLFSYNKNATDFFIKNNSRTEVIKSNGTEVYEEKFGETPKDTTKLEPLFDNYGYDWNWLPWVTVNSDEGLLFGGGRNLFKYGYDRKPFIYKLEYWMAYATKTRRVRAEFTARFYPHSGMPVYNFSFYATGDEVLNYYGRGNDTYPDDSKIKQEYYDIDQQQFIATPSIDLPLGEASRVSIGTTFKYVQTEKKKNTYVTDENPFGIEDIVLHSIFVSYIADTRNGIVAPTSGYYLNFKGTFFPGYLKNNTMFGKISLSGRYYYEFNFPFYSSLAFRSGLEKLWGTFPFFESTFIGGQGSLRGVEKNRFAGDASLYAGVELRSFPLDFYLIVPAKAGFTLFAETARVFIDNQYSGMWYNSFGGGLLISLLKSDYTFSFSAAVSREDVEYYFITGFAF